MTDNVTRIVAISGGLREPSSTRMLADSLSEAVAEGLTKRGQEVEVVTIDLRRLARSIADAMTSGFANEELEEAFDQVRSADGVIAVTPAFNASYSGLFKSFFDVLPEETMSGMPVLMGATGGTERHSLILDYAMRPLFSYLRAVISPTGVYAATSDFASAAKNGLGARIERAADEFVRALAGAPPRQVRDAWSEDLATMADLLPTRR